MKLNKVKKNIGFIDFTLMDKDFNILHRSKKRKLDKAIPEINEILDSKFDLEKFLNEKEDDEEIL